MEFTFEKTPEERLQEAIASRGGISALECLEMIEDLSEEEAEETLHTLAESCDRIDISHIPQYEREENTARRLQLEDKLAKSGDLMTGLEENDPLRLFLEEVAAMPTADEKALLAQYTADDEKITRQLAECSLGRVVERACRMTGHGVLLLDLIQEGCLGLWYGIMKYTGGDYEAHVCGWIDRYLKTATLMQAHTDNVIYKARQGMADFRDADQKLLAELGRNPTVEEIAEAIHCTPAEAATYAEMLHQAKLRRQVDQLSAPKEQTPDDEQPVESTAYFQMRQRIADMLSVLDEQEAKLLTLRFGLEGGVPMDAAQVGQAMNLTAEEVTKIEAAALQKLRQEQ